MGVLERIEANFVHLSPKEQLLATYIMQESPYFTNITISEMAKETGVSAATITRFCRKVGCESFVDLKIQLQASEGELLLLCFPFFQFQYFVASAFNFLCNGFYRA